MKKENEYQPHVKKRLMSQFPDCIVFKTDPTEMQGIPDLIILYNNTWAALETKRSVDAPHRPNQDYYVDKLNTMSFSRFIYPENEEEIFDELERTFRT